MSDVPVVGLEDVTQVYVTDREATLAIDRFSLTVQTGEFVSLVGPSGCGKTTILSMIAGLLLPSSGQVHVLGRAVQGPAPVVGYMLQQDYLFPWRTILENAMIGLELTGQKDDASRAYTLHLLEEMGLQHTANLYPHQLSGGMRQRVALVRTLATKPDILLLDEPFSALDYQTKLQLEDLVAFTMKQHKKTAILVTHDLSEAVAISDRVIVLESHPGRFRKEFQIPDAIRNAEPFYAREQEGFNALFHEVWKELESTERRTT